MTLTPRCLSQFAARQQRYCTVDGGSGANLFATLPTLDDRLRKARAPAHLSLLIVAAPIADKLHGAVADTLRPRPSHEEL